MHQVLRGYGSFVSQVLLRLEEIGIMRDELLGLDHLCYRVASLDWYNQLKGILSNTETLVDESQINGRPIAVFALRRPLVLRGFTIPALELPAPSQTRYPEGLEHAEFIVKDLQAFMDHHPNVEFITKDLGKEINPEVAIKLPGGIAAKFHLKPLLEVVELQRLAGKL